MPISVVRVRKRIASVRLARGARRRLDAAPLCALATITPAGRAHINTMYFARADGWDLVWLSAATSQHSRNIRAGGTAAVAVYESHQRWGGKDRGIQMFGRARELRGRAARDAKTAYRRRFASDDATLERFAAYRMRPTRLKLFDEREFGIGTFITARVRTDGTLASEWAETYRDG